MKTKHMKIVAYFIALLFGAAGVLGGGYIFIFWGIIEPIMDICKAIDTHTVTASLIGWSIVKFLIWDVIAYVVAVVGLGIVGAAE